MKKLVTIFALSMLMMNISVAQRVEDGIWNIKDYSEEKAKRYFVNRYQLDIIEGIWQSSDGFKYSIEKDLLDNGTRSNDTYRMIILESSSNKWDPTYIKAFITYSSVSGIYSMKYYTRDYSQGRVTSQQTLLGVENAVLLSFTRIDNGATISLFKLYPKVETETISAEALPEKEAKSWQGSSIAIGGRYFATNHHVVDGAKKLVVSGAADNYKKKYNAEVVATDSGHDLAIIKVIDSDFQSPSSIPYGFITTTSDVGCEVFVMGYPIADVMGQEVKLTTGVISARTGFSGNIDTYQISAPVQSGNSGGPLFDDYGNLIGIVNAGIPNADNVGYAIKLSYLKTLAESCNIPDLLVGKNEIAMLPLTEKVKRITPYVYYVEASTVNDKETKTDQHISANHTDSSVKSAADYLHGAYQFLNENNYTDGIALIEKSISIQPNGENHLARAHAYWDLQTGYEKIIESAQFCIEHKYNLKDAYRFLAYSYFELNKPEETIIYANELLKYDKRCIDAIYKKGKALMYLDKLEDSKTTFLEMVKYDGIIESEYFSECYYHLALVSMWLEEDQNALMYIEKALKISRDYPSFWKAYGQALYFLDRYEESIYALNNSIIMYGIENVEPDAYFIRGRAYMKLGYELDAYNDFTKVIGIGFSQEDEAKELIEQLKNNNGKSCKYSSFFKSPKIGSHYHGLSLKAIELNDEYTALYLHLMSDKKTTSINPNSYIYDMVSHEKLYLLDAEGIGPSPTLLNNGELSFILIFPKVSKYCLTLNFREEEIGGFYIDDIYIGESNAPGIEPTTIDEVLSILANLKKEAMSTTDKTRLSDLLGRLNKIDNWYFNYPKTNIKVGQLIRDIKRIIKDKL